MASSDGYWDGYTAPETSRRVSTDKLYESGYWDSAEQGSRAMEKDPYGSYFFALEINGTHVAYFLECSGLKSTAEVFEIVEGGMNGMTHKRPGQSRWENITLRYATNASTLLLEWRDRFLQDGFAERTETSGAIVMMDNDGTEVRRFEFNHAWPVSWEGPALNAGSSELAVETIEIAHDGLTVSTGGSEYDNQYRRLTTS